MSSTCILILLDGIGDRSHASLGHRTPLEAAHTPHLDSLAACGANGLFHASFLGQALPSEDAHFAMFGYQPDQFPGRGPLETLGAGLPLADNEVAILAHAASVREEGGAFVLHRAAPQVSAEELDALLEPVSSHEMDGVRIRFHRTKGFFGVLVLSGMVAPWVTDTDPIQEGRILSAPLPWGEWRGDPATEKCAAVLAAYLRWVYRQLRDHPVNRERVARGASPVNFLVTQRAGRLKPVPSFTERFGMRGLSISSGQVYWGLGTYLGMTVRQVRDSDRAGLDLAERLVMAHEESRNFDFIHVHSKAPDEAGHSRDPQRKVAVIESLDRGIGSVLERLRADQELLLAITADHSTPSSGSLIHSGEPVPLTFVGEGMRRDRVARFNEIDVAAGALGTVRGEEFMYLVLNFLDRARMSGLRNTPEDFPWWPGDYAPFRLKE